MSRKKSQKMNDVFKFHNVFNIDSENIEPAIKSYFGNNNPITLEIGCGKGDYTIELAKLYPDRNFIGIDYKGARVFDGAITAVELKLPNAGFIVCGAERLGEIFTENTIEEIFITFPDPHKTRNSFRRLVNESFLDIYRIILKKNGKINLKTDNEELYQYALNVLKKNSHPVYFSTSDLYSQNRLSDYHFIQTKYEKEYLSEGKKIKYISFGY
ncbi:tRNA (guanosine(46)-N7)-methyltransferase TrmB [Bacteroidota bacterium]